MRLTLGIARSIIALGEMKEGSEMTFTVHDYIRALGLCLALLIVLGIDRFVADHWGSYDIYARKGFVVFNLTALTVLICLIKEERWPLNVLALGGALVTFFIFVPLV